MGSKDSKFGSRREDIYIGRFALILIAVAIAAMAVIELTVALNLEFTRTSVRKAMWAGALLWVAVAAIGWVDKFKKNGNALIWCVLLFTAVAAGSVAGIYMPTFVTFALWANTALSVLFLAVIVWAFPQGWRNCAAIPVES